MLCSALLSNVPSIRRRCVHCSSLPIQYVLVVALMNAPQSIQLLFAQISAAEHAIAPIVIECVPVVGSYTNGRYQAHAGLCRTTALPQLVKEVMGNFCPFAIRDS